MIIRFQLYPRIFFAPIRFVGNPIPLAQAVPFISKKHKERLYIHRKNRAPDSPFLHDERKRLKHKCGTLGLLVTTVKERIAC